MWCKTNWACIVFKWSITRTKCTNWINKKKLFHSLHPYILNIQPILIYICTISCKIVMLSYCPHVHFKIGTKHYLPVSTSQLFPIHNSIQYVNFTKLKTNQFQPSYTEFSFSFIESYHPLDHLNTTDHLQPSNQQ